MVIALKLFTKWFQRYAIIFLKPFSNFGGRKMSNLLEQMKNKIEQLNNAAKAYYQEDREIMSNFEYDKLYDELQELEKETGIVLANSPSINVGYEVLSTLPKEQHEKPMLSLDKTKDADALKEWLGNQTGMLSWKESISIIKEIKTINKSFKSKDLLNFIY